MSEERRNQGLDGVRGFAALFVVLAHVVPARLGLPEGGVGRFLFLGQEAVIVFFLLSGAVIRLSVRSRGDGVGADFIGRRFLRLYPILALGVGLGYVSEAAVRGEWPAPEWGRLLGNLGFLQDFAPVKPGVLCETYYSNGALWSLSYEWWFYVFFLVLWNRVAAAWRTHVAGACSFLAVAVCFGWPNAAAYWVGYFIIWWTGGVFIAEGVAEKRNAMAWLAATTGLAILNAWWWIGRGAMFSGGVYPVLLVRHLGFSLAAMGVLWFLAARHARVLDAGARVMARLAWIAPYSYALYVLHSPLAGGGAWLGTWVRDHTPLALLVYGGVTVAVVWWAEKIYHPWLVAWLKRAARALRPVGQSAAKGAGP